MASERFARELRQELSGWLRDGLISEETAAALSRRYEPHPAADRAAGRHLQIFLGILCAALIGSGLILLISHNWDQFPPGARLAFAYGPLVAAVSGGFFVLRRHADDRRWCEPAALLLMAAAAAAIAIVSQVYQVLGSPSDFILLWLALMVLPLYCFRSTSLALVFGLGFAVLSAEDFGGLTAVWKPLFLVLAVLPYLWRAADDERSAGTRQLSQLVIAALLFFLNIDMAAHDGGALQYWLWPGLFTVLLLSGRHLAEKHGGTVNALSIAGALGFMVMLMAATFEEPWSRMPRNWSGNSFQWGYLAFLALAWLLLFRRFRRSGGIVFAALLPLIYEACRQLGLHQEPVPAMLLGNLYAALLGLGMLVFGYRGRSAWQMNSGLAVLAVLIAVRFCNVGNILLYAATFLFLGVAVGIVNLLFARHLKHRENA